MELRYTAEEIAFREEVRAFCKSALPEDIRQRGRLGQRFTREDIVAWQRILNARGWAVPGWPVEWGGAGWDAVRLFIFKEELYRAFAPEPLPQNVLLVGPVIIAFGTAEQKKRFLPGIRNLDMFFCQGFSEPGAGSDLASLKTRAERDGDHYIVNGQKLWTSDAHRADWIFALVRTDANVKKQQGISYLLIDMKSPGVTVRPVILMDGDRYSNEVFFDNVRVPVENRIGEENKGWGYAKYLLGHERAGTARLGYCKARIRLAKELAACVVSEGKPLSEDPRFREEAAALEVELMAIEMTAMIVAASMNKQAGFRQDPRASVLKIKGSEMTQAVSELLFKVAGPHAAARQVAFYGAEATQAIGPAWAATPALNYYFLRERTIAGGSSEVQHNVIAKNILGL